MGSATSVLKFPRRRALRLCAADLPTAPSTRLHRDDRRPAAPTFLRHPFAQTNARWYGNVDPFSIGYALRPRLRSRLTLSGRTFLRNPEAFGGRDSHPSYRYSYRHSHFRALHGAFRYRFGAARNAPLPSKPEFGSTASASGLSPVEFSAQGHSTSELLRTL